MSPEAWSNIIAILQKERIVWNVAKVIEEIAGPDKISQFADFSYIFHSNFLWDQLQNFEEKFRET